MPATELLQHLSIVAVTLAGFSGLVVALGRRSEGHWTTIELRRLTELLGLSLSAAMFAILPALLGLSGMAEGTAWRFAAGTTCACWLVLTLSGMFAPEARRSPLAWAGALIALLGCCALTLIAVGTIQRAHVFLYALAIFAMISTAAARFYWLLMTGIRR